MHRFFLLHKRTTTFKLAILWLFDWYTDCYVYDTDYYYI